MRTTKPSGRPICCDCLEEALRLLVEVGQPTFGVWQHIGGVCRPERTFDRCSVPLSVLACDDGDAEDVVVLSLHAGNDPFGFVDWVHLRLQGHQSSAARDVRQGAA